MDRQADLNSLMLFYEVIQAGSLTAASVKLKVAKSTISRQLARMEQHFGPIVVKKNARQLTLTEVGAKLHQHCQKISAELQEASCDALTAQSQMQGNLRISIPGDLGVTWVGSVISDFARRYPELTIAIRLHSTDAVDLNKEPFDIAIQLGETQPSRVICKHLATLTRHIYASPAYLERHGTPVSLDDSSAHTWIVTDVQEREGVWLFRRHARGRALHVPHRMVANSVRLTREFAFAGLGLALLPDLLCAEVAEGRRLVRVLVPWQSPPLQMSALFLSRDRIPRKARAFLDFFAEQVSAGNRR